MEHEKDQFVHPGVGEMKDQLQKGTCDRREFVRSLSLLGVSAGAAYAMSDQILGVKPSLRLAKAQNARRGGTLRCSMVVQEMTDPATFSWVERSNVSRHMVEYLTETGADNVTRPSLCRKWRASRDLKTWTLSIRRGVKWSNGDTFDADDVVANFNRWLDPEVGSSNLGLFKQLTSNVDGVVQGTPGAIERVNRYTVRLHLATASLAIPESLFNYPTAIVHRGFNGDISKERIGTGAYTLSDFAIGEKATLVRRDGKYWGDDPYLDSIEYYDHGSATAAALQALSSDQVDTVYNLDVDNLGAASEIPNINLFQKTTGTTPVIRARITEAPFDKWEVRRALQLCCDPAVYPTQIYGQDSTPGEHHHVAPVHPDYYALPKLQRNIEEAKKLLAQAGYPDGIDVTVDCGNTDGPTQQKIAEIFKQQCEPAGIRLSINILPASKFWEIWDKTPYGITQWVHRPLGTMVLSLGYRTGVPWNETALASSEFDLALDEAEATVNVQKRIAKMQKVEQVLQDSAVITQPLWNPVFTAAHTRLQNFDLHPTRYHLFNKV
ncbi:MAG: ABC transporter substrate-binding protein, partial [Alphaproteobacteria bacterium]|nr:ABC transporter substrate-binding protein [Alphaproteobacteria bacterium]